MPERIGGFAHSRQQRFVKRKVRGFIFSLRVHRITQLLDIVMKKNGFIEYHVFHFSGVAALDGGHEGVEYLLRRHVAYPFERP